MLQRLKFKLRNKNNIFLSIKIPIHERSWKKLIKKIKEMKAIKYTEIR